MLFRSVIIRSGLFLLFQLSGILSYSQIGKIGLNTNDPKAMLHVMDSNVVFTAAAVLPLNPGNPPVSGAGNRMMWYADKAAFRSGSVTGNQWDKSNIGTYSFASGSNTRAWGSGGFAIGYNTSAGNFCFAGGSNSIASDYSSFAFGTSAEAAGYASTAFGAGTALGQFSAAFGYVTKAVGSRAFAFGEYTIARAADCFVTGRYNDTTAVSIFGWDSNDPVFIIGNGSNTLRANALTVLKNGNTGISTISPVSKLQITNGADASYSTNSGYMVLGGITGSNVVFDENEILARNNGTASTLYLQKEGGDVQLGEAGGKVGIGSTPPSTKLHITGGSDASYSSTSGFTVFGPVSGTNVVFDDNEILARSNGAPSSLHFQVSGGNITMCEGGGNVGIDLANPLHKLHVAGNGFFTGTVTASCGVLACSDMRYKKNIIPLRNSLDNVLSLSGIYYDWDNEKFPDKSFNDKRQIGFSAQELEGLYPEMVHTDEGGYKSVDYSRLTPVLVEAMKEQQEMILFQKKYLESQQSKIETLEKEIQELKALIFSITPTK